MLQSGSLSCIIVFMRDDQVHGLDENQSSPLVNVFRDVAHYPENQHDSFACSHARTSTISCKLLQKSTDMVSPISRIIPRSISSLWLQGRPQLIKRSRERVSSGSRPGLDVPELAVLLCSAEFTSLGEAEQRPYAGRDCMADSCMGGVCRHGFDHQSKTVLGAHVNQDASDAKIHDCLQYLSKHMPMLQPFSTIVLILVAILLSLHRPLRVL